MSQAFTEEKRILHARKKLSNGYILIIGTKRRNAHFFKPGKGFEPFKYRSARILVTEGLVVEKGEHYLGMAYVLSDHSPIPTPALVSRFDEDDLDEETDRMDTLLDEINNEGEADT